MKQSYITQDLHSINYGGLLMRCVARVTDYPVLQSGLLTQASELMEDDGSYVLNILTIH